MLLKVTVEPVKVLSPPLKVVAPTKSCVELEVISPPKLDVPDTLTPPSDDASPSKSKFPVIVMAFDPPLIALRFIVEPCKTTAVLSVVVSEKVWFPVVVTFPPRSEVPDTSTEDAPIIAAFRSRFPVIFIDPNALVAPTALPNCTSPVPELIVRSLVVLSEFTVPLKTTLEFVVVRVLEALKIVFPV